MAKKSSDKIQGVGTYGSTTSGGSGSSGTLSGSAYDYSDVYGGKPDTADPSSSAAAAISGTSSNLGSLYNLSSSYNTASAQQAVDTQNVLTPGYSGNMSKWASDISDMLSGKVSSDTKYNLSEAAAERGISTGTSGSQNSNSAYLRALGLTSVGLQQTGASQLASMISSSPKSNTLDMSQYLTSASDQQAAQQYANTVSASAVPSSAASASQSAAQSGVNAGLTSTASSPSVSTGGGGSSIASLLSSILGQSPSAGVGQGTSSIQSLLNSITGQTSGDTTPVTGNTGIAGWDSQAGDSITGGAQSTDESNYYDNANQYDYSGYA